MVPPVDMLTVTTHCPPFAAALQLAGLTLYGALNPLMVKVAAWVPLFVNVTVPLAAAPPLVALSALALLLASVMADPVSVPLIVAVALPAVPPFAVKVCVPCAPKLPPVVMVTVTTHCPPFAAALQLAGLTL